MIFPFLPLCGCHFLDLSIYYHALRGLSRAKQKNKKNIFRFRGAEEQRDNLCYGCRGDLHPFLFSLFQMGGASAPPGRGTRIEIVDAKAGYRRANDKGQWWEAGASGKKGSEQNGKGRVPKKIPKRQANAESH